MLENLHFRFALPGDIDAAARLVTHSFPGPARAPEWWAAQLRDPLHGGGPETLVLGEAAGRLVAACQVHPLRQWIAGAPFACAGIGTVSIAPTHRRQGLAGGLATAALRAARERGDTVSALFPFREEFYRKLGFGRAGVAHQFRVAPGAFPDAPERLRVELLDTAPARAEALALYATWVRSQSGQIERTPAVWSSATEAHDRALVGYRAAGGALEGYALVVYRADLPAAARYLEVDELVWTTPEARLGLLGWLGSLGDQWKQIVLRALPSQEIAEWLREPRLPVGAAPMWRLWQSVGDLLHGPMFRLLDARGAWAERRVNAVASVRVGVELSDAALPENAGRWRLVLDGGRAGAEGAGDVDVTLRLDVSTLSRLFIGSLRPSGAAGAGLLECDRPELLHALDAALVLPEPWTFDRF